MLAHRLVLSVLTLSVASPAWADDAVALPRQTASVVSSSDVLQWLVALLLVLGVFLLSVWLLRKSGSLGFAGKGQLAILAGLPLGMREKLVLVKVGEKQLLLGVSSGRIDKLLELDGDQRLFLSGDQAEESAEFAKKLLQAMQGRLNG